LPESDRLDAERYLTSWALRTYVNGFTCEFTVHTWYDGPNLSCSWALLSPRASPYVQYCAGAGDQNYRPFTWWVASYHVIFLLALGWLRLAIHSHDSSIPILEAH